MCLVAYDYYQRVIGNKIHSLYKIENNTDIFKVRYFVYFDHYVLTC